MAIHQIELDAYFQDFVDLLIQSGQYASVEDVLIAGLELLDLQESGDYDDEGEQDDTQTHPFEANPQQLKQDQAELPTSERPESGQSGNPFSPLRQPPYQSELHSDPNAPHQDTPATIGQQVDLPDKVSVAALNTFMDDNLQALIDMLDAKEADREDEAQNIDTKE